MEVGAGGDLGAAAEALHVCAELAGLVVGELRLLALDLGLLRARPSTPCALRPWQVTQLWS